MADYTALKAEVQRCLALLRRDHLDFLNIAFMRWALDHDPAYLDKIARNTERLKKEGLIRFACLDTFSGEWTYLRGLEAGCFDAIFINFNLADDGALRQVLPAARQAQVAVLIRECFMKGRLFTMGEEVGLTDRARLAQVALKWCLVQEGATMAVVGSHDVAQMASNLQALQNLALTDDDCAMIERLRTSNQFQDYRGNKHKTFFELE
jgi:aryl-alcohol dehydrogenase-like predicted oxidoreductase